MAERVLQRVIMPPRRRVERLYYRTESTSLPLPKRDRRALVLPRGTVLRTDTWFNAFFEGHWRKYTLAQPTLRVRVSGSGVLRLYRRSSEQQQSLLHEIDFSGHDRELCVELFLRQGSASRRTAFLGSPDEVDDSDGLGSPSYVLYFELEARSSELALHSAEWTAEDGGTPDPRLAVCVCTFNRPARLLRNLRALFADADVAALLDRIIVVDQGTSTVRERPAFPALMRATAGRLHLIEQDNHGGSGGFTRGLLESQCAGSATHVLLMDDDIILEPESILRAAAYLSLAHGAMAVGGHMLDRFRPCQLVESGSRFLPEHVRIDEPARHRLDRAGDLLSFLEPQARHYNGWWFFAFPLTVLERVGLPLPLFLRGDDVEFGCRLMRHGVPTIALPGVGVWHEPFERKSRGWHAFYELRNLLIVGALHFPLVPAKAVARRFFSRLLDELLAYDYHEAWLMCEAAAAYLRGPDTLHHSPHALHRRLLAMGEKLAPTVQANDGMEQAMSVPPRANKPRFARAWRWLLVFRNLLWPSPAPEVHPQRVLQGGGEQWYEVAGADVVGVAEPARKQWLVLRRSRGRFAWLFFRGLLVAFRLFAGHRRAVGLWRADAPVLASPPFWKDHLGMPGSNVEPRPFESREENRSLTVAALQRGENE